MNKNYAETLRKHRRRACLDVLLHSPANAANHRVLAEALNQLGVGSSADQVLTELAWLTEQGLVDTEAREGVTVAGLTPRGLDAATGLAAIPGLAARQT